MDQNTEMNQFIPIVSGNRLSIDGDAVVKEYRGEADAYYREHAILERLSRTDPALPLPRCLPGCTPGVLRTGYIQGISGVDAVSMGNAREMLWALGDFLRQLHLLDTCLVSDVVPGTGRVIVHGDFAHHNCLMSEDGKRLMAVLDWETVHLGSELEDLSWCEHQFLNSFPHHAAAASALYEGYGQRFDWELRRAVFEGRMQELTDGCRKRQPSSQGGQMLGIMNFRDSGEAAAFVAALSRFLNSPSGSHYLEQPLRIVGTSRQEFWLSEAAINATAEAFGCARLKAVSHPGRLPPAARTLIETPGLPAWGIREAERNLSLNFPSVPIDPH